MQIELDRYLEDLENRLNPDDEQRLYREWLDWADHKNPAPFQPTPRAKSPSRLEWPHVNINDAVQDDELSVYRELEGLHRELARGSNSILRVRANYGVGNVATAFGAETYIMPRETDTLPNVLPLREERARRIADQPLPPPDAGNFKAIFRIYNRYRQIINDYPKLGNALRIEQPDLQGPMDNLELIWGSDMFYALYDDPEIVHALLGRFTDFIERFMDEWLALFPNGLGVASYFRHVERGGICVRNDSAMNLSPEFFSEYIAPYDGRLLRKYGGIVHFCGRGDHFISRLAALPGLKGINMSQPHLNDMDKVFAATIDRGIHLSLSVPPFKVEGHDIRNLVFLD